MLVKCIIFLAGIMDKFASDFKTHLIINCYSKQTIRSYLHIVNAFLHFANKEQRNIFTSEKIFELAQRDFITFVAPKLKPATINLYNAAIGTFAMFLIEHKDMLFSYRKQKTCLKAEWKPLAVDRLAMQDLLMKLKCNRRDGDWISFRDYAFLMLLYGTGMRVSEALNFRPSDMITKNAIIIRNTKGSKERIVYIPYPVVLSLEEYMNVVPHVDLKHFWFSRNGSGWNRFSSYRSIKSKTGYHPHVFRHTFATHMIEGGCNIAVLQELLGHESINTTQRYLNKTKKLFLLKCIRDHHPISRKNFFGKKKG